MTNTFTLADALLMQLFGSKGNTQAHRFLKDRATLPIKDVMSLDGVVRNSAQIFIPPHKDDRVIMFSDKSGVYVYKDGFCTPMGSDISHEVVQWKKV